ncbi:hypothetical protein GGR54DRAFT_625486 [Hypoxylon sp. NC1633]|nr:hypothetical protein GGR54DRAFT_625486 [Hypoxylon sp. NC1633]
MDKQLDTCFDRVEKALGMLVDSIAKYHPSVSQVNELGQADIELNKGLEDLQNHQTNYKRIQDLRTATASFDAQIKDTLRLLANTRKELVGAPATVFPVDAPSYDVNYDELLAYARRISKTTMPPASAVNSVLADAQIKGESNSTVNGGPGAGIGMGTGSTETIITTPAGGTPNGAQVTPAGAATPANANGALPPQPSQDPSSQAQTQSQPQSQQNLPEDIQWHLNPQAGLEFIPWPNEEQVRKGALASLAYISEQGINPENYDPEAEKARKEREEEELREAEERERIEREERERRAREEQSRVHEREAEAWRRASVTTGAGGVAGTAAQPMSASPTGEKKQFQFMADDDDDDDDDE